MLVLSKVIYRVGTIPIRISTAFFMEMEKLILRFRWNYEDPCRAKTILEKNCGVGGCILPSFETYFKATVIRTVWCWRKA
jgi:hypothetical protein